MTRKLAMFGALDALSMNMNSCVQGVQQSIDSWRQVSGMGEADWLDQAGGQFAEISRACQQVMAAGQELMQAMNQGVQTCNQQNMAAVQRCCSRLGS
ncbi:hypothetical protein GCM10011581_33820 [Saccharopolyspora subtropica]|uniref:ESAT-6-like protein n=1 Tax=Saccharopolyspora thermophila TaxID=89367 RepID=A0A917JZ61_9PSEU|nr:hypothetical protein [Saccharopolyspora subtropica]GGI93926.1 hypothetical protein GCM10011581_33820 [Saccharopolyspora subtropica]